MTGVGGEWGYDGAKKIKGRKRHLLVDTQGLVLTCTVHTADMMDRDGVTLLLSPEETPAQFPRLAHVWLDAGYNGHGKGKDWIEKELGWTTETVRPPSRRVIVFEEVEPAPTSRFYRPTAPLGCRADLCLARTKSPAEQRLRTSV